MQRTGNVAIFWDYENCPAPASASGYAIANSIYTLARSFGSVKVFKAYQEISDQSRSSLRSELQSSGVSLVDCPHNGRKEVADKMILVDMLSYAIDNSAPSTVFLITGDRDFAYALSVLKNRHYTVVLVKRPATHVSLTSQTCFCFDWFDDIVHQVESPSSLTEQRPQRALHRQCSYPICNAPSSLPSPWYSATEGPIGSGVDTEGAVDTIQFLRDRIPDRALQEHRVSNRGISFSPKHRRGLSFPTSQKTSPSNSALAQEEQQTSPNAPNHQFIQPETPCNVLPPPNDAPPAIKDEPSFEPLFSTPSSRSPDKGTARAHFTKSTGTLPELLYPTKVVLSSISPLSSPVVWPAPALTIPNSIVAKRVVKDENKPTHTPNIPRISAEELAENFLKSELANDISTASSSESAIVARGSRKPSTSGTTADNVQPWIEFSEAPNPAEAMPANPIRSTCSGGDSRTTSETASEPSWPPVIPPNFVILVEILQRQRSQGIFQSLRSLISARISEKGATYQKAGVSSFRQYALLAEQAGIIDLGGYGGRAWICLKPKWHSVPLPTK